MKRYSEADPEEWRLLKGSKQDTPREIKLRDIPKYVTSEFFLALRFWKRYKRFGIPGDWREMTPAQLDLLDLFDRLDARRQE